MRRARVALVVLGLFYAWTAWGNYYHLRPWRDGSLLATEPTGELGRLIELSFVIVVFTGIASVASLALAAIARTKLAVGSAIGIFAVYTALRLYQTEGRCLTSWLWWLTAIVLGVGVEAAFRASASSPAADR